MLRAVVAASIISVAALASPASARILTFDLEAMAFQKAMAPATTAVEREQKAAAIRYVTELMRDAERSVSVGSSDDQARDMTVGRQSSR